MYCGRLKQGCLSRPAQKKQTDVPLTCAFEHSSPDGMQYIGLRLMFVASTEATRLKVRIWMSSQIFSGLLNEGCWLTLLPNSSRVKFLGMLLGRRMPLSSARKTALLRCLPVVQML